MPRLIPRLASVALDGLVLAFALGASVLTSFVFGLLPALHIPEPAPVLRGGSRGNTRTKGGMGWSFLVAGQVALAVSLVVASGLLLRSMREILTADTHFRPEGVLSIALDFSASRLDSPEERGGALAELKAELSSLQGVTNVGYISYLPDARTMMTGTVYRPPWPVDGTPEHMAGPAGWRVVDEDYFRVMGIPLLEGRAFTKEDGPDSPPVIILNEAVARSVFPDVKPWAPSSASTRSGRIRTWRSSVWWPRHGIGAFPRGSSWKVTSSGVRDSITPGC